MFKSKILQMIKIENLRKANYGLYCFKWTKVIIIDGVFLIILYYMTSS